MNMEAIWTCLSTQGADLALKIVGAIVAWVAGRWLIGVAVSLVGKALEKGTNSTPP